MKCNKCGYDDNGTGDSAHMCATPAPIANAPAVLNADERKAFEAWILSEAPSANLAGMDAYTGSSWRYFDHRVERCFIGWKAKASQPSDTPALTKAKRLSEEFYDGTAERDWPLWSEEAVSIIEIFSEQKVAQPNDARHLWQVLQNVRNDMERVDNNNHGSIFHTGDMTLCEYIDAELESGKHVLQPYGGAAPQVAQPSAASIHYPDEWDTAAYPTLESALDEIYAWFKTSKNNSPDAIDQPQDDVAAGRDADAKRLDAMIENEWQVFEINGRYHIRHGEDGEMRPIDGSYRTDTPTDARLSIDQAIAALQSSPGAMP